MALTCTIVSRHNAGDLKLNTVDVTFDSSYPAGGEAVTPEDFGLENGIVSVIGNILRDPDTADNVYFVDFDATNSKLVVAGGDFTPAAQGPDIEVSGFGTPITNLSAYTARLTVLGK